MLERLSGLDAVFLSAESANNHMHMMAIMILDPSTIPGGYVFERFRRSFGARLLDVTPLRRKLVEVPFGIARPCWIEDPDLDINRHIRRAAVPSPGGPREVAELAGEMNSRPLDRGRPLWEMLIVEGLESGSIAVLAKIHHAVMDGIAGMQFLTSLLSLNPESSVAERPEIVRPQLGGRTPGSFEMLIDAVPDLITQPALVADVGRDAIRGVVNKLRQPKRERLPDAIEIKHSSLNGPITSERSVAYTSLRLDHVKAVGDAFSATVNEVVLAAVAGAVRRHLIDAGQPIDHPLVAAIPVSTHAAGGDDVSNSYAVIFGSLATHIEDPVERLQAIRSSSRTEKRRNSPFWGSALTKIADIPPPFVLDLIARAYGDLGVAHHLPPMCNLVVSNVPGPPVSTYFAGARVQDLYPLGPIFDGIGLNITVISVSGELDIGLVGCRGLLPDLWRLAGDISEALNELAVRMPAREPVDAAALSD